MRLFAGIPIACFLLAAPGVVHADAASDAVQAVEKVGGRVIRDDTDPGKPVVNVIFQGGKEQVTDALPHLKAFPKLQALSFPYVKSLDDKGSQHLAKLTGLKSLTLVGTSLTDAGLKNLADLANLERLELAGTPVTDAGLKHLAGLKKLRYLGLNATAVTGDGLKDLSGLKDLEQIELFNTPVTDAGLKHLHGMKGLKRVNLRGTKVTDSGKKELQAAIPGLKIE
jgi:internalin A